MTADPGFHPEARAEFLAGIDFLNHEQPGMGDEFERAFYATADTLEIWPLAGAVWPGLDVTVEVRWLGVSRFPFRVVLGGL